MKRLLTLLFSFLLIVTQAQSDTGKTSEFDPKFYCSVQDRFLNNHHFIRLALAYELEKRHAGYRHDVALPNGYQIGSVDEFLKDNPECCFVERDPKAWRNQSRSWLARLEDWLDGETVFIAMYIPSETVGAPQLLINYLTDECGEMKGNRYFSMSNHYFTE